MAQQNFFTRVSGQTWTQNGTWSTAGCNGASAGGQQPGDNAGDTATICAGHTVSMNSTTTIAALTVTGTLTFATGASRTLTVSGNVTVNGTFNVANDGTNRAHTLNVGGDWTNDGAVDFNVSGDTVALVFNKAGASVVQTASGGGTADYFSVTVNMGTTTDDHVDWQATALPGTNELVLTKGTFKYNVNATYTPFSTPLIAAGTGFWTANGTVRNTNTTYTVRGLLRISGGTQNIGNGNDDRLVLDGGSTFLMEAGGTLNVAGRLVRESAGEAHTFTMTGGTITIGFDGASNRDNTANIGSFQLESDATFNMSGGTLIVRNASTSGNPDAALCYINLANTSTVTGGTIQIGGGALETNNGYFINSKPAIGNLVIDHSGVDKVAKLVAGGNHLVVLNDLTINGSGGGSGSTLQANDRNITLGTTTGTSTWTNNGIFTAGTGTVTFTGTTTQTIAGSSTTTFNNMEVNKSSGTTVLTVNPDALNLSPVVSNTLTFTAGRIDTRTNGRVIILDTAATAVAGTLDGTRHVNGCVRKNYLAAATGYTFPTGDGTNYTPVTQTFNTTAGAVGDVTACVTAAEHPQVDNAVATTGIDETKSVNRYWSLTDNLGGTGTPSGAYGVSFTYLSSDNDGTGYANYIIERYLSGVWYPTAVSGTPNATNAATTNGQTAAYGEYAIGEPLAGLSPGNPGRFNAFETSTTASAIIGRVNTRVSAASNSLAFVAINSSKTGVDTAYTTGGGNLRIWVIDASDDSGTLDVNGCRTSWVFRGTATAVSTNPGIPGGAPAADYTMTFAGGDLGRKNLTFTMPGNSYRKARLMMQDSTATALIGCSSDPFALRPQDLFMGAVDQDWLTAGTTRLLNNTGATGGVVHAASTSSAGTPRPFNFGALPRDAAGAATSNYVNGTPAGAPTYTSTYAGGLPTCGSLPATCTAGTLTPSTLAWSAGTAFGFPVLLAPVNYSEAGTFLVEFEDATFANVDIGDGTPATGASGRTIPQHTGAGTPIEVGRFVPASFTVTTTNAPQFRTFDSSCAGARSFTYIGQTFDYATKPTATITAVNAAGVKTSNYNGALWKIGLSTNTPSKDCTSNPDICVFTNSWSGGSASSTLTETYTYSLAPATTPNWNDASVVQAAATVTAGIGGAVGTGTVTFASSSVFAFKRSATTPLVPFTASISDSISVQDTSETNAIGTSSAAAFSVGFDSGNEFRYGRARLQNATGSEVINLKVPFRTEYYTGAGFQLNAADNCTSVSGGAGGNFAFSGYSGGLNAGNLPTSNIVSGGAVTAGVGSLTVNKPSAAVSGSVTLCLDLETNDGACSAGATAVQGWLQGPWGSSSHDKDPRARVAFGLYGAQPTTVIFFRENY